MGIVKGFIRKGKAVTSYIRKKDLTVPLAVGTGGIVLGAGLAKYVSDYIDKQDKKRKRPLTKKQKQEAFNRIYALTAPLPIILTGAAASVAAKRISPNKPYIQHLIDGATVVAGTGSLMYGLGGRFKTGMNKKQKK
jgi:hypothetical protein